MCGERRGSIPNATLSPLLRITSALRVNQLLLFNNTIYAILLSINGQVWFTL